MDRLYQVIIGVTLFLALGANVAVRGQQRSNGKVVKVVTVCEVLGNVSHYADTVVAVVGRMERSISLTDSYEFLSQDRCERPVITHGHVWLDKIEIVSNWEIGLPKPPSDRPKLERSVVAPKLLTVRKTTRLGFHETPQFRADGHSIVYSGTAEVPNDWAVVYGRIMRVPNLTENCGREGCGGDNVPLVIIAEPYNVHRLSDDATPLPEDQ